MFNQMIIKRPILEALLAILFILILYLIFLFSVNKRLLAVERERCKIWDYKWCSELPK